MSTTLLRLLLAATAALAALFAPAATATAGTVPTTPTTAVSSVTPTTVATPRPANPDDGFQPEDVFDWLKDNVAPIIVVVGLVLLVVVWKYVSRPSKTKF